MYLKKKMAQSEIWRGFNLAISGKLRQLRQIFSAPIFVRIMTETMGRRGELGLCTFGNP